MYVVIFLALACAYAGYALWSFLNRREKFSEDADPAVADEDEDDAEDAKAKAKAKAKSTDGAAEAAAAKKPLTEYDARVYVMRMFDTVLKRKPSDADIAKYSKLRDESAILGAIVSDYKTDKAAAAPANAAEGYRSDDDDDDDDDSDSEDGPSPSDPSGHEYFYDVSSDAPKSQDVIAPAAASSAPSSPAAAPAATGAQAKGGGGRVCLDKSDVLGRLAAITREVSQFSDLVRMM
jgi:hypothetical protein